MKIYQYLLAPALLVVISSAAFASSPRSQIVDFYRQQAGEDFSAERGKQLFSTRHDGGKPETPSCTTCHTSSPKNTGKTRVGKPIAPMAVSRNADRYTDLKKVEKWFRRNCRSVLGRECSPREKGDFLTFMINQ